MVPDSIIAAVKNKERDAFKELYNLCIPYVYTVSRRHLSNESDLPDILQEVFARIYLSIGTFDPIKGEFKFWLRRLVINECYQHYRKEKNIKFFVELDQANEVTEPELTLENLSREEIEQLLSRMPEGYRRVFLLVVIDECSHQEVGQLLGITAHSSRSQLSRAKKWLKKNTPNSLKTLANGF